MTLQQFLERHGEFLASVPDEDLHQLGVELREIAERRASSAHTGAEILRERPRSKRTRRHI